MMDLWESYKDKETVPVYSEYSLADERDFFNFVFGLSKIDVKSLLESANNIHVYS